MQHYAVMQHYHGTSMSIVQFFTEEEEGKCYSAALPRYQHVYCTICHRRRRRHRFSGDKYIQIIIITIEETSPPEYINMKKLFLNVDHPSQSLWAPMYTINFENNDELKIFKSAVDDEKSWLSRIWLDFQSEIGILITGWSRFHAEFQR